MLVLFDVCRVHAWNYCGQADALAPKVQGRDVLLVCMDQAWSLHHLSSSDVCCEMSVLCQVVSCDGQIREKPETEAEARRLCLLRCDP